MFKEALIRATAKLKILREEGDLKNFALIGDFAVARWGIPRATGDIDFAIELGTASLSTLAQKLNGIAHSGDIFDPLPGSVSFEEIFKDRSVPIQLIQFPSTWENIAF